MSSRSKARLVVLGLFLIAVLVGWFAYNGGTYTVVITQQEAQTQINMALEKRAAQEKSFKIESVKVWFENNQIKIDAKVSGKVRNRIVSTGIHGEGVPEYRNGSFYFRPTVPVEFSKPQVDKIDTGKKAFSPTKELLKKKAEQFVAKHGLDEIARTFKYDLEVWTTRVVQEHITIALSEYPLYTLEGGKGIAIKTVLERVDVVGDKLHVTLSGIRLGYTIVIAALLLGGAIGLAIFLIKNPGFGFLI